MTVETTPRAVLIGFLLVIAFLLLANLVGIVVGTLSDGDRFSELIRLFDFGPENNIPTLYSSLALVLCALLLLLIARTREKSGSSRWRWLGLAVVFLFLSIDEAASVHEASTPVVRESLHTSGLLHFAWVIPYGAALIVFLLLYLPFLAKLPRKTLRLFVISGATYVAGAMGLEMIGALHADLYGTKDLVYSLMVTAEELLEMLGIAVFIYALLDYVAGRGGKVTLTIGPNGHGGMLPPELMEAWPAPASPAVRPVSYGAPLIRGHNTN